MATPSGEEKQVTEEYQKLNKEQVNMVMHMYELADEKRQHEYLPSSSLGSCLRPSRPHQPTAAHGECAMAF